ncbi:MAG: 50S ribosomal protein L23 [Patescibacteria group bacterium]|jgi:large subunit ribosomal protein L23
MGLLDRFKKKFDSVGKDKQPRNIVAEEKKEKKESTPKDESEKKEQKPKEVKEKKRKLKENTQDAYRILVKVLITEKASLLSAQGQYAFAVSPSANKAQVAEAIRHVYGVTPLHVNIMNVSGRKVRFGKTMGTTKAWKKAIVTLKQGDKIDVYEGV